MNREAAKKVLVKLATFYPNWKFSKEAAAFWLDELEKSDGEHVEANASEYVRANTYPPTLADIVKNNPRVDAQREINKTTQLINQREEYAAPPWIRAGISREEWMRQVMAKGRGL